MSELSKLESVIDSAVVKAVYDGFQVKVSIITGSDDIETACYLYDNTEVVSKNGYKNNSHSFTVKNQEGIKCKVFFRLKNGSSIKKSKFYPVFSSNSFRYQFSNNITNSINFNNSEIIDTKPNAIEIYEQKGFKPRNDNIPYILTLPIDWLEDPFDDRNWMFQLHAWRMLDAYFKRSDDNNLKYIAQVINDWVLFEKSHESKWLWYDMSTGLRALKITLYLKLCYEKKISHKIDDLDYLLHEHFRHLSNPLELNTGNHGLFQLHGLKSLAYIVESCDSSAYNMSDMKDYANEKMSELITSQLGLYGVHTEDSPDYHFFAHKKITNILNSPWWNDLDKKILKTLELGNYAKSWLVSPDDRCVTVGDSTNSLKENLPNLENWPHTKIGKYVSAQVDGYAVIRSDSSVKLDESSFLFFQGSFYSQTHKHCDDLSFILKEKGMDILIDSGKYGYQQDKYRKYFLSTRAHNTIEVDGKSTSRNSKNSYGSAILGQPVYVDGFWLIRAKVDHEVNQYIHERVIIYKPGKDLYVLDKLTNTSKFKSREISQWWHFDTDIGLTVSNDKVIAQNDNNKNIKITSISSIGNVIYNKYKGYESGNILIGWVSKKYLEYEPTSSLNISSNLHKTTTVLTRFELDAECSSESDLILKGNEVQTANTGLAHYFEHYNVCNIKHKNQGLNIENWEVTKKTNYPLESKINVGSLLANFNFNDLDKKNIIYLEYLDERQISLYTRNFLKKYYYFLLTSPDLLKIDKVKSYINTMPLSLVRSNDNIAYCYSIILTITDFIENSIRYNMKFTDGKIFQKWNAEVVTKYNLEQEDVVGLKVGNLVAKGHIASLHDRSTTFSCYRKALKLGEGFIENFLPLDPLSTYYDKINGINETYKIIDYDIQEVTNDSLDSKSYINICFSTDLTYFKKYITNWANANFYFNNLVFNFGIVTNCKDEYDHCVTSYHSIIKSISDLLNIDIPRNFRFYWIKSEIINKTVYACARFYLAKYLVNKYDGDIYISDIDQLVIGDFEKYLEKFKDNKFSVYQPISSGYFSILPGRSHMAGNIYIRNDTKGKKYCEILTNYVGMGLGDKSSWILDQNATRFASELIEVGDLNIYGPRALKQYSSLKKKLRFLDKK